MRLRTPRDDDGGALILALIVMLIASVLVTAVLSFADTNMRASVALGTVSDGSTTGAKGAVNYEADAAAQTAIDTIEQSNYNNTPGESCFGSSSTLLLPSFAGPDSAAVTCTPLNGTGGSGSPVPISSANKPGNAILTLGSAAGEDGLNITSLNTSNPLKVHGYIYSHSSIRVTSGSLVDDQPVIAEGTCAGAITTPSLACNSPAGNPLGNDPNYAPALAAAPAYQPLPPCTTPNSVVTFSPGYYDDAVNLSNMMKGNSACKHSTWWFKPGTYYFDFHNTDDPAVPSGSHVWTVNDGTLVAGTPSGGAATPPVNPTVPGSCVSPINSTSANGVQFVFGNDSQLVVDAGHAEICGTYSSSKPPVAIYGLNGSGTETRVPASGVTTAFDTGAVSPAPAYPGDFAFSNPANVQRIDGTVATWNDTSASTKSASVEATGFRAAADIPKGSILNQATLTIVHGNSAGYNNKQDSLSFDILHGTTTVASKVSTGLTLPATTGLTTDSFDVTSLLRQDIHDNGLLSPSSLAIVYRATLKHIGVESVDAITLGLAYTAPALRGESGCVKATPYPSSKSACAALLTTQAPNSQFYVQGTTYMPGAAIDISLNNVTGQVFKFGVISRALVIKQTGSASFTGAVIEVPNDSTGNGAPDTTDVFLIVYICPGSSTCSAGSTPARLRVKVTIKDQDPNNIQGGKRQITIDGWSVQ